MNKYATASKEVTNGFGSLFNGTRQKRAENGKVEAGDNVFRILPPHVVEGQPLGSYVGYLNGSWLPAMVDEYVNNETTGKKKRSMKLVYSALTHSTRIDFDIVNEYIKYVENMYKAEFGSKESPEFKEALLPIYGDFSKKMNGIRPKLNPYSYVLKIDFKTRVMDAKIQLLNLKALSVVKQLKELQATEQKSQAIRFDIYSSPEDGIPFHLVYTPKPESNDPKDIYKVYLFKPQIGKTIMDFPLTDEILTEFETYPSLIDLYGPDVYKLSDFNLALEGIKLFDADSYKLFENDPVWVEKVDGFVTKAETALSKETPTQTAAPIQTAKPTGTSGLPFASGDEEEEENEEEEYKPTSRPTIPPVNDPVAPKKQWGKRV